MQTLQTHIIIMKYLFSIIEYMVLWLEEFESQGMKTGYILLMNQIMEGHMTLMKFEIVCFCPWWKKLKALMGGIWGRRQTSLSLVIRYSVHPFVCYVLGADFLSLTILPDKNTSPLLKIESVPDKKNAGLASVNTYFLPPYHQEPTPWSHFPIFVWIQET